MSHHKDEKIDSAGPYTPLLLSTKLKSGECSYLTLSGVSERLAAEDGKFTSSVDSNSFSKSNRKPFHYPVDKQYIGHPILEHHDDSSIDHSARYKRYLYYSKLTRNDPDAIEAMRIPEHVLPYYFLIPQIPFHSESSDGKQGSILTIFAVWNMLMGTSLLCIPWAMHKAGFALGTIIMLVMIYLCYYTSILIIKLPKLINENCLEFSDACYFIFGRWAQIVCTFASLLTLFGTCIVYWILMSNFLFNIVSYVYESTFHNSPIAFGINGTEDVVCQDDKILFNSNATTFSNNVNSDLNNSQLFYLIWNAEKTVPFILAIFVFPVLLIRSPKIFMKCNAIGTVSVAYLLAFIVFKAGKWDFLNFNFTDQSSLHYSPLFSSKFAFQTGVLSQALFVHNCILTTVRLNRKQENNSRDIGIAFVLGGFTYAVIAIVFYLGFPLAKTCLKDNLLDNFQSTDILTFITRVFLFIQIFCLYPLYAYMLRVQILNAFFRNDPRPKLLRMLAFSALLSSICILFAVEIPSIGTVIRFSGSFAGGVLIFVLPPIAYSKALTMDPKSKKTNSIKDLPILQTIFHILIFVFGVFNCVLQFLVDE
ncbi:sodium-coupled neutral amino acid transporter 9-like protein [Dinothrombium tinctorium]|uniref:Sodium-coupled neutral amino acid transporter 9-like protein n=1 Tax=Dinothrombium tinctorium TaxID=1965070 RepID=A0A3S4QUL7_9ACAR|nr:sodium-coupled neutral amino acid transporter 9-like protein [Dinothrombium tinctorium]